MGVIQEVGRANANSLGYKIVIWLNWTLFSGENKANLPDLEFDLKVLQSHSANYRSQVHFP